MYQDVLVPTDGSDCAAHAVDHTLEVAADHDATVHALFVVDSTPGTEAWADVAGVPARGDRQVPLLSERGREVVESVAERARNRGIDVVTDVREGRPHEGILGYVDENGVDLVVMGTHGRSGVRRFLLGSVTEAVVRGTRVPVLCVTGEASTAVDEPEKAVAAARRALERRGIEDVAFPTEPSRQRTSWVVPAEGDGNRFNVHVSATGETSVAPIGETSS